MSKVGKWDKQYAVAVLSGLSTVPDFHANGIRLDWLRLFFEQVRGYLQNNLARFQRVLNEGLSQAGVNRLENPNEDLLCDLIPV